MAEALTRAGLRQRLGPEAAAFEIGSAGTWGHEGAPMEPFALAALAALAVDASAFRARELMAEHVAAADLVLAATREHRAAAVVLQPRAARRTFTLREFDRLLSGVDPATLPQGERQDRARAVVAAAVGQRGLIRAERPEDDDLGDPHRAPESAFTACGQLVLAALQRPLDLLGG